MNFSSRKSDSMLHLFAALGSLLFLMFVFAPLASAQTFTGELTDQQMNCMQHPMKMPAGITQGTMKLEEQAAKMHHMKAPAIPEGVKKTACMLYWAHYATPHNKWVLYVPAKKTAYELDNQGMVEPYIGSSKVQITGTLNASTKTIHVTGIKAL